MSGRHIDPERAQFDAFKALPRDTPIHMLNFVRFKDRATYPDAVSYTHLDVYKRQALASLMGPRQSRLSGRRASCATCRN